MPYILAKMQEICYICPDESLLLCKGEKSFLRKRTKYMAKVKNIAKAGEDELLIDILSSLRQEFRLIRQSLDMQAKLVFTTEDMMDILCVSAPTLREFRESGKLGYTRHGRMYYYSREDLEEFIRSGHQGPAGGARHGL